MFLVGGVYLCRAQATILSYDRKQQRLVKQTKLVLKFICLLQQRRIVLGADLGQVSSHAEPCSIKLRRETKQRGPRPKFEQKRKWRTYT